MNNRYSNQNRDPREIVAKFDGICAETGKPIKKGEQCVYYPTGKKIFSMNSQQALEFRNWRADLAMGFDY